MKTHKQLMDELKQKDAELYNEIISEAAQEIEEIKRKWGGKRLNAGRPRIYEDRKTVSKQLFISTIARVKEFSKIHKISENEALERLINTGYECIENHKQAG
jgi:hypothetical protein